MSRRPPRAPPLTPWVRGRCWAADAPSAPYAVANGGTPVDPPTATDTDTPKATAVSAQTVEAAKPASEPLAVIATNGSLGNGHAANGNGKTTNGNGGSSPVTLSFGNTKVSFQTQADAPSCAECGSIMVRNGSCYKCLNCGSTSGCS